MAKPTPAAAGAPPVLDEAVEPHEARRRFRLRLPAGLKLPRLALRLPALPRKALVLIAAAVVGLGGIGAAAYAFWPAAPEWPVTPVQKPKKAKRPKAAASAASAAAAASAASAVAAAPAPLPAASAASAATASAASAPESPMDRLQRRLAETLGAGGKLETGAGELKLTSGRSVEKASTTANHAAATAPSPASRVARAHVEPAHWSYEGADGPDAWARLSPGFAQCASGTRQSPIDIRDGFQVQLDPVRFDYKPSAFRVVDNGHTVQVNVAPGNAIEVMGQRFELQQFHFHRPSEERIAGKRFDMVAHLVHRDAQGRLAVVAVLLEQGGAQPVVQAVWNNLPLEKGEELAASTAIDLRQLLPSGRGYFTYMGSLTTPPCSEGVLWLVMKQPVPVSPEQMALFARLYPMNARPVQPAAGRMIKESD